MSDDSERDRVAELLRWEDAGATWQVIARNRHGVTVAMLRCDGGEEVDRFTSNDPRLLAFVGGERLASLSLARTNDPVHNDNPLQVGDCTGGVVSGMHQIRKGHGPPSRCGLT